MSNSGHYSMPLCPVPRPLPRCPHLALLGGVLLVPREGRRAHVGVSVGEGGQPGGHVLRRGLAPLLPCGQLPPWAAHRVLGRHRVHEALVEGAGALGGREESARGRLFNSSGGGTGTQAPGTRQSKAPSVMCGMAVAGPCWRCAVQATVAVQHEYVAVGVMTPYVTWLITVQHVGTVCPGHPDEPTSAATAVRNLASSRPWTVRALLHGPAALRPHLLSQPPI